MNPARTFIEELLFLVASRPRRMAGVLLLKDVLENYRSGQRTRTLPVEGFRPRLTAHNQRGQLYRHLRLHLGLRLLGGPFVALSFLANLIDHYQAGKDRPESRTELLDNHAARLCAAPILTYYHEHLPYETLRHELTRILCEPSP